MSSRRGFTLIELLLVVSILALVAASASSLLDEEDRQLRWDETKRRAETLRAAIVGRPDLPTPSGYVADTGALPGTLQDLIAPAAPPAGWRGPYVTTSDGRLHDGWGNGAGDTSGNFGWQVTSPAANTLEIRSLGGDGLADVTTPTDPYDRDLVVRIEPDDHLLRVAANSTVTARLVGLLANPADPLRLRVSYPGGSCVSAGAQAVEDPAFPGGYYVTFTFAAAQVPIGVRTLEVIDASDALVGVGPPQQVELWPRASLPTRLPAPWRLQ